MSDIRIKTDGGDFGFRAAGIMVSGGRVLLQKPIDSDEYAIPGGHVKIGEAAEQTLIREFDEEIGARVEVGALRSVEEVFWRWNGRPSHTLCLYFEAKLCDGAQIPTSGRFMGREGHLEFFLDSDGRAGRLHGLSRAAGGAF